MELKYWEEASGVSVSGASGVEGGVDCNSIINFLFLIFMGFHGVGGVRG